MRELLLTSKLPDGGFMPRFGPVDGMKYSGYGVVKIGAKDLTQYAIKLVRGLTYLSDKVLLPKGTYFEFLAVDVDKAREAMDDYFVNAVEYRRGDAIVARRASFEMAQALYHFVIWKRLEFYVTVDPKNGLQAVV